MPKRQAVKITYDWDTYQKLKTTAADQNLTVHGLIKHWTAQANAASGYQTRLYGMLCQINETIQITQNNLTRTVKIGSPDSAGLTIALTELLTEVKFLQQSMISTPCPGPSEPIEVRLESILENLRSYDRETHEG